MQALELCDLARQIQRLLVHIIVPVSTCFGLSSVCCCYSPTHWCSIRCSQPQPNATGEHPPPQHLNIPTSFLRPTSHPCCCAQAALAKARTSRNKLAAALGIGNFSVAQAAKQVGETHGVGALHRSCEYFTGQHTSASHWIWHVKTIYGQLQSDVVTNRAYQGV